MTLMEVFLFKLGILACLDGYMNIAMEQTEEYVNGQLKNKYGDAFIRGNNGMHCAILIFWDICCANSDIGLLNTVLYISTSKRTLTDGSWEVKLLRSSVPVLQLDRLWVNFMYYFLFQLYWQATAMLDVNVSSLELCPHILHSRYVVVIRPVEIQIRLWCHQLKCLLSQIFLWIKKTSLIFG